jgi:katanin p60 ATPase-containing subunit A1
MRQEGGLVDAQIQEMEKNGLIVTMNDILMALENVSKSVGHDQLERFQKWEEEFGSK